LRIGVQIVCKYNILLETSEAEASGERGNFMTPGFLFAGLAALALVLGESGGAANGLQEAKPRLSPGEYESFLVGLDRERGDILTGYYSSSTGRGQFSCRFFLRGTFEGERAQVTTWLPGSRAPAIKGTLEVDSQGGVRLRLESEPDGCGNVQRFADAGSPARFSLLAARPWRWVRVVRSGVAAVHLAPGSKRKSSFSFSRGEGVGCVEERLKGPERWLRIREVRKGRSITGWLNAEDLYPVSEPGH
jgi:hypothetical protein